LTLTLSVAVLLDQQLQQCFSRKSSWGGPDKQFGFGSHKPDNIIQDSHLVLDDPTSKQAIKP
jgi:hypothetical protein